MADFSDPYQSGCLVRWWEVHFYRCFEKWMNARLDSWWFVHLLRRYIGALLHERSDCEPEGVEHGKLVLQHYRVTTSARMWILPLVGRKPECRWFDYDDIEDFVEGKEQQEVNGWRGKKNHLSSNGNEILLLSFVRTNKYCMSLSLYWAGGALHIGESY